VKALQLIKSKFLRDSVTLQMASLLNAAGNLTSAIVLARLLGAPFYGVYIVAISLYATFFLSLSIGFSQITVSQVARHSAAGEPEHAAEWLAFLAKVYFLLGLFLVTVGWLIVPHLVTWWESLSPGEMAADPRDLGMWVFWLTFTPLLDLPRAVTTAAFQGTRRMLALAQIENGTEIVRVFLVIIGAMVTADPVGPLVGTIAASAIGSVLALDRYRRARHDGSYPLPVVRSILKGLRAVPIREGARAGVKFGIMRGCDGLAINALPPLIIQHFTTSKWVAYFRIAHRFMSFPVMLMSGVSRTALPALSELAGIKDMARFRHAFKRITILGGLIVITGVGVFLPFIPLVTRILMPEDYVDPVTLLSRILALGFLSVGFAMAVDAFYIVTNRIWVGIKVGVIGFFVTVPGSVLLASQFPETGVAWGTVFSMSWVSIHLIYIAWYFRSGQADAQPPAQPETA
jgi:O-antigen/teichoic acid export membrane protein